MARPPKYVTDADRRAAKQATNRRWSERHPERAAASKKVAEENYKRRHPDRRKATVKRYLSSENGKRKANERTKRLLYGVSADRYREMFEAQGGTCAICNSPPGAKSLSIDHDHATGKVRALLCSCCNSVLGMARESEAILTKAIAYLRAHA